MTKVVALVFVIFIVTTVVPQFMDYGYQVKLDIETSKSPDIEACPNIEAWPNIEACPNIECL